MLASYSKEGALPWPVIALGMGVLMGGPSPRFFVGVDSKAFSYRVSYLESTLLGLLVSVDSKWVPWLAFKRPTTALLLRSACEGNRLIPQGPGSK
jgi:hypothetical protein